VPDTPPPDFVWYLLNETSGTTAHDSSPHRFDITNLGGVVWESGASFDGTATCGYTTVAARFRDPPVTISAWLTPVVRDDELLNEHALVPYPPSALSGDVPYLGGYGIGLDVWNGTQPGAALAIEDGINAGVAFHSLSGPFATGAEHFVALAVVSDSASVYVDGSLFATVTASPPPSSSPTPLRLGCTNGDTAYQSKGFFKGRMRDARVYTRVVGSAEISQLYVNGPATTPP
jgi:hypothetical protein